MAWDDTKKEDVIEAYKNADPTPETSVEIVKEIQQNGKLEPNEILSMHPTTLLTIRNTRKSLETHYVYNHYMMHLRGVENPYYSLGKHTFWHTAKSHLRTLMKPVVS